MCRFYKKQKEGNLAEPTLRLVELPKLETFKIHCKFTSIIAAEFLKSCILGLGQPQYSFVAPCEWRFGLKGQFGTPVKWVITCKFWFGTRLEKKSLMNNCKTSDRILQHLQVDQNLATENAIWDRNHYFKVALAAHHKNLYTRKIELKLVVVSQAISGKVHPWSDLIFVIFSAHRFSP